MAFNRVFGQELFPYLTQHPTAATVFEEAMTNYTKQVAAAIVAAYDFSQFGTLVDVGGGYGTLLTAVLQAHPVLHGVLFDLPKASSAGERHRQHRWSSKRVPINRSQRAPLCVIWRVSAACAVRSRRSSGRGRLTTNGQTPVAGNTSVTIPCPLFLTGGFY